MIATLSLNPAVDKIVSLEDLRHARDKRSYGVNWGAHVRVKKIREVAAGKGINVARVIKKLGGEAVVIGVAGGPNGEWIKEELRKENLKFDFVSVRENVRESLTIMDELRGREIHLREEGAAVEEKELNLLRKKLRKWASKLSFFVISGRLPKGVPQNFYNEIIAFFRKRKVPVLLDANGPALRMAVSANPDYIKPNLGELEELAGKSLKGRGEEIAFIKRLLRRGIDMAVVTDGPGEVLAMTSSRGLILTPPSLSARNTVGSGDAVTGALAYGLTKGFGFEEMLKLSIACGSANALSIGAGFLDIRKVNNLIKKINVKVLYNHCN